MNALRAQRDRGNEGRGAIGQRGGTHPGGVSASREEMDSEYPNKTGGRG